MQNAKKENKKLNTSNTYSIDVMFYKLTYSIDVMFYKLKLEKDDAIKTAFKDAKGRP